MTADNAHSVDHRGLLYNAASECPNWLGRRLGHRFIPVVNTSNDEREAIICSRCGLVVGPRQ